MLRWSSQSVEASVQLAGVTDPSVDTGVPGGSALLAFTDAVVQRVGVDEARTELVAEVGEEAAAMAATVAGNFEMMNRILDATGVPAPRSPSPTTEGLGIDPATFGKPA